MEGADGLIGACGCAMRYNLAELRVLRAIMALSGFGRSPAGRHNRGKASPLKGLGVLALRRKTLLKNFQSLSIQYSLADAVGIMSKRDSQIFKREVRFQGMETHFLTYI